MVKGKIWLTMCLICLLISAPAHACTLFAATGNQWVEGGGTLINKNRDWWPEPQSLRLVPARDEKSFAYYGLFAGEKPALKGGVNERGLVVVSASAGTIPRAERLQMPRSPKSILRTLLSSCASVDEALQHTDLFIGPVYIMLADSKAIAYVEIGPEGKYAIRRTTEGILYHTNCYVEPDMLWANQKNEGNSSRLRYQRIGQLLQDTDKPFDMEDFIDFSEDRNSGDNNSIWRIGSKPQGTQTLAAFTVYLPVNGLPVIRVKIRETEAEKGQEKIVFLEGDDLFKNSKK